MEVLSPPAAPRRPHRLEAHGHVRIDDWYWLADRSDPEVLAYLEAENAYAEAWLAPTRPLQDQLFRKIRSRVVETDAGPPVRREGFWYWSRTVEGLQYPIVCRRPDPTRSLTAASVLAEARAGRSDEEEVVLDENALAGESAYLSLGVFDLSPDQSLLAYAVDLDGSERHTLRFRRLPQGKDLDDVVEGVYYGSAWSAGGEAFYYVRTDASMRPWQVWRHRLGEAGDELVFEEPDERFYVEVGLTRSRRFVVLHSESKTTSEAWYLDAGDLRAEPALVLARQPGVEYDVEHAVDPELGDVWLLRSNLAVGGEIATDFAVHRLPVGSTSPAELRPFLPHRPGTKVEAVSAFKDHAVVAERSGGLQQLRIVRLADGEQHTVAHPEPAYSLSSEPNPEWGTTLFRFGYTSFVTPRSSVDYNLEQRTSEIVWSQPVPGYDPSLYRTERLWATAADGAKIPISLVAAVDRPRDASAPLLLYGYGAYEACIDPAFSVARLNLLEAGFAYAVAHVRGGGELGRSWYDQGRLEHKTNTFSDFIAAALHLVDEGWTSPSRLAIRGASAGGLLVGAVTNMAPELWWAVIAEVPFVDVVTTMSDPSLPLTVTEWEEWGDPLHDPEAYWRMLSYSPYDNVTPGPYPAMYVTAGLNDPRVGYWEPAKWVAKLRALRTDERPLLLRTEMGAGHRGSSGRYEAWRDEARIQAFLLSLAEAG